MLWNLVNMPTGKSSGKAGGGWEIKVIIIIWDETLKVVVGGRGVLEGIYRRLYGNVEGQN